MLEKRTKFFFSQEESYLGFFVVLQPCNFPQSPVAQQCGFGYTPNPQNTKCKVTSPLHRCLFRNSFPCIANYLLACSMKSENLPPLVIDFSKIFVSRPLKWMVPIVIATIPTIGIRRINNITHGSRSTATSGQKFRRLTTEYFG